MKLRYNNKPKDLDLPYIHDRLDPGDLNKRINKLRAHKYKSAVCTSVLGVAFDILDITFVLQYGCPRNCTEHEQQTSRCGHNGQGGWAYTFVSHNDSYPIAPKPDYWGVEAIQTHTIDDSLCRRVRPNLAIHSVTLTCVELTPYHPCDVCERDSHKDAMIRESSTYPSTLV